MAKGFWKKVTPFFLPFFLPILILGIFLRFVFLEIYPPSLTAEESLLAWRAKSLLETGKDETGRNFPLIFSSLDGYQLPASTYLLIPSVKLLGLNEQSVRLPFGVLGSFALVAFYIIVRNILPIDRRCALWGMFFLAVNPWSIWYSRVAFSAGLAFWSFLLGLACLFLSLKNRFFWPLTLFLLLGSLYADKIAWFFVLPFLFFLYFFLKRKAILIAVLFLLAATIPLFLSYFNAPQALADLKKNDFNLFEDIALVNAIDIIRGEHLDLGLPLLGKLFYNKLYYSVKIAENLTKHLNPRFYFAAGDQNPLHGFSNFGPILLVFLLPVLFGLKGLVMQKKHRWFLIVLFFLGLLPSIWRFPSPDQEKSLFLMIPISLMASYGLAQIKNKLLLSLFLVALFINFLVVSYDVLAKETLRAQEQWNYGYKQLSLNLRDRIGSYDQIYITDTYGRNPGPSLLFYLNYPAEIYLEAGGSVFTYRTWINKIGKIEIGNKENWSKDKNKLFVLSPKDRKEKDWLGVTEVLSVIKDLKGEPIFTLTEHPNKGAGLR